MSSILHKRRAVLARARAKAEEVLGHAAEVMLETVEEGAGQLEKVVESAHERIERLRAELAKAEDDAAAELASLRAQVESHESAVSPFAGGL